MTPERESGYHAVMKPSFFFAAVLLTFLSCFPAFGEEEVHPLLESFLSYEDVDDSEDFYQIVRYEDYLVFGLLHHGEHGDYVGGFAVYPRTEGLGEREHFYESEPLFSTERDLEDAWAAWLGGIFRHYLFVDFGTGPGFRGLEIYDLADGNRLLASGGHYSGYEFADGETAVILRRIDTDEVLRDYPDVYAEHEEDYRKYMDMGLWYSFVRVFHFSFEDFSLTDTGEIRGIVEQ